jgi:hypothetical protein
MILRPIVLLAIVQANPVVCSPVRSAIRANLGDQHLRFDQPASGEGLTRFLSIAGTMAQPTNRLKSLGSLDPYKSASRTPRKSPAGGLGLGWAATSREWVIGTLNLTLPNDPLTPQRFHVNVSMICAANSRASDQRKIER